MPKKFWEDGEPPGALPTVRSSAKAPLRVQTLGEFGREWMAWLRGRWRSSSWMFFVLLAAVLGAAMLAAWAIARTLLEGQGPADARRPVWFEVILQKGDRAVVQYRDGRARLLVSDVGPSHVKDISKAVISFDDELVTAEDLAEIAVMGDGAVERALRRMEAKDVGARDSRVGVFEAGEWLHLIGDGRMGEPRDVVHGVQRPTAAERKRGYDEHEYEVAWVGADFIAVYPLIFGGEVGRLAMRDTLVVWPAKAIRSVRWE